MTRQTSSGCGASRVVPSIYAPQAYPELFYFFKTCWLFYFFAAFVVHCRGGRRK